MTIIAVTSTMMMRCRPVA